MLIREAIENRLSSGAAPDLEGVEVRLPLSLKRDRVPVRTGMIDRTTLRKLGGRFHAG